jgi:hypothetical protein
MGTNRIGGEVLGKPKRIPQAAKQAEQSNYKVAQVSTLESSCHLFFISTFFVLLTAGRIPAGTLLVHFAITAVIPPPPCR